LAISSIALKLLDATPPVDTFTSPGLAFMPSISWGIVW